MKLPTIEENPNGLHMRYRIFKIGEEHLEPVDPNAEYFVLRLDEGGRDLKHVAACRKAIHAYADAIKGHLPVLASDLKKRYPLLELRGRKGGKNE